MYSNDNVFVNNTFTENAAGGAVMFSRGLTVRNNHFVSNRGLRAYGLIFQSTDNSLLEQNEITQNAVGLSFNQCNGNRIIGNRVTQNYIGLKFGSNSDDNRFTENVFARNLHPVETGGATGSGDKWAVNGVGNRWDGVTEFDLDHDGVNDLPHRELDLFGILRRDFPAVAFLSDSPAVKLLRFAQERAALPGLSAIDDPSPLTSRFWNVRAQRAAQRLDEMIEAANLQKAYGRKAVLRGMSLRVAPGELTLLVGANGAGKSTTMKISRRPGARRCRQRFDLRA